MAGGVRFDENGKVVEG